MVLVAKTLLVTFVLRTACRPQRRKGKCKKKTSPSVNARCAHTTFQTFLFKSFKSTLKHTLKTIPQTSSSWHMLNDLLSCFIRFLPILPKILDFTLSNRCRLLISLLKGWNCYRCCSPSRWECISICLRDTKSASKRRFTRMSLLLANLKPRSLLATG